MISTTYNAQFLTIDFRLLDSPPFCAFMRSPAFPLYLQLRRYVWRGANKRHPVDKVNELYAEGYLVCAVPRSTLAEKLGISEVSHISRHLSDLEKRGVLRKVRTGRQNVYVLGTWEDRSMAQDRSTVLEIFFLEQHHGAEPFDQPRLGDLPPGLPKTRPGPPKNAAQLATSGSVGFQPRANDSSDVSPNDTSDVSPNDTADVSRGDTADVSLATPSNKEVNREENTCWDALGYLDPVGPEAAPTPIPNQMPSGGRAESRFAGRRRDARSTTRRRPDARTRSGPDARSTTRSNVLKPKNGFQRSSVFEPIDDKEPEYEPNYPVIHVRL